MTLISRSADHRYTYEGVTYPGVTSILKVIDKSDALMSWASRMTAEAAISALGTLPQLIESVGPEGAIRALTARSAWKRDEAAALGTEIHRIADLLHRKEALPELSDLTRSRVTAYAEWWDRSGWRIRATEALLVNTTVGYGGTLDLLCYDRDGRTVLADIKTGSNVYREVILQLAAYGMSEWLETDGGFYEMPAVDRYAVLHVTADGVREVEVNVGEEERKAFRACIRLSAWRDQVKGRL